MISILNETTQKKKSCETLPTKKHYNKTKASSLELHLQSGRAIAFTGPDCSNLSESDKSEER